MQTIWNLQMIAIICKKTQIQLFANCKLFAFCKQFIVNRWWWLCCVACKSTTSQHNQQQQQTTNFFCLHLQTIWNLQMIAKNTNTIICKWFANDCKKLQSFVNCKTCVIHKQEIRLSINRNKYNNAIEHATNTSPPTNPDASGPVYTGPSLSLIFFN